MTTEQACLKTTSNASSHVLESAISLPAQNTDNNVQVTDTRPPGSRVDYTDVSKVEKYEMPVTEYESRTDSVLAWKKKQNLGRFDPNAPSLEQQKIQTLEREVEERGM